MAFGVRSATGDDLEAVARWRVEFLGAVRGPSFRPSDDLVVRTRAFVEAEHASGRLRTWIAEDGDEFVGLVSLLLRSRPPQPEDFRTVEGYIVNLYVPSAHRRQGIGRKLLEHCISAAESLEVRTIVLHSTDDGRALYESMGFAPTSNWLELPIAK